MREAGDPERRPPVAVTILAQIEIVADAMESGRQETDTAPGVEPGVGQRQLGRIGPYQHRRERGLEATSGWLQGTISLN